MNTNNAAIHRAFLHRDPAEYSGHPRQTVFAYFGGGEKSVGQNRALCRYESAAEVQHDFGGYHSRAKIIVQRTLDGGRSWPADQEMAVDDETITPEQKDTDLSIGQIARLAGFSSQQRMGVLFRAKLGSTPGQYRQQV